MSDLLTAAAQALSAPEAIVKRSAEARAKANGVSLDDILVAWAGGGSVAAAPSAQAAPPAAPPAQAPKTQVPGTQTDAPVEPGEPVAAPVESPTATPTPVAAAITQPVEAVEPVPLRERVRLAGRVGAWTGAALGVLGTLVASPWLLPNASLSGAEGDFTPSVLVPTQRFGMATALMSILFGLIVAALSRTLTGWLQPGAALVGRHRTTGFIGAALGLVLGLASGSVLTSAFGEPAEGAEGVVNLPILSAVIGVLIGGAVLGWVTAALVQLVGVPAALAATESEEVSAVRARLGGAIAVPLAGLLALVLLVIPYAIVLIRSDEMTSGGAAVLAVITAGGILAISGLSASRPGMTIRRGDFLVALGGIGVVVLIIFAVLLARSGGAEAEDGAVATETTDTTVAESSATTAG